MPPTSLTRKDWSESNTGEYSANRKNGVSTPIPCSRSADRDTAGFCHGTGNQATRGLSAHPAAIHNQHAAMQVVASSRYQKHHQLDEMPLFGSH